jgi:hypothetical protein
MKIRISFEVLCLNNKLSSVPCLLARDKEEGKGILMIDRDLDNPILHKYIFQA